MTREINITNNPFVKIFSKEAYGGMEMAIIAVHKDDLESVAQYDPDEKFDQGNGFDTCREQTLQNIKDNFKKYE